MRSRASIPDAASYTNQPANHPGLLRSVLVCLGLFAGQANHFAAVPLTTVPAAEDTFLTEHSAFGGPSTAQGAGIQLWLVRGIEGLHRSFPLVQFDLTPFSGRTVTTSTAELVLHLRAGWSGNHVTQSVSVRESLVGWNEGTASYANFGGTGFSEAIHTGPNLVTRDVTYLGVMEPVSFTISSAVVQQWIDAPSSNNGLFLISNTSALEKDLSLWSQEGGESPTLSFELTPIPEPTTFALLSLGSLALVLARRRR